jgi:tetratricopeptide (TPR) repeat protein
MKGTPEGGDEEGLSMTESESHPERSAAHPTGPRANQSQADFEIEFFDRILAQNADYVDVLRVQANNLSAQGLYARGLAADRRIVQLRPNDPNAYYNLACSYSLLQMNNPAIDALQCSLKLGYRDFEHLMSDPDLEHLRKDARFVRILGRYLLKAVKVPRSSRTK